MARTVTAVLLAPVLLATLAWGAAALWIDGPSARPLAGGLALAFVVAGLGALSLLRPVGRGLVAYGLLFLAVLAWWLSLSPSNDRDWQPEVARLPSATVDGDRLTIRNLRNFDYHAVDAFDERWETRTYDLSELRGVDLFLSYWGSPWIAHTIASWDFGEGRHLAISIETRKERGEAYSAVLGFFRQFEIYYVVGDERDLVEQRTNHRREDVYLYRLRASPEAARAVLLDYLDEVNALAEEPAWYNAALHNCTTTIRYHAQNVTPGNPWHWRILVNGRRDELGYERGSIDTSLPFEEVRERSRISERGLAADGAADFSERIRVGLPQRPARRSQEGNP